MIEQATVDTAKSLFNLSVVIIMAATFIVGTHYLYKFVRYVTGTEKKEEVEAKIKV